MSSVLKEIPSFPWRAGPHFQLNPVQGYGLTHFCGPGHSSVRTVEWPACCVIYAPPCTRVLVLSSAPYLSTRPHPHTCQTNGDVLERRCPFSFPSIAPEKLLPRLRYGRTVTSALAPSLHPFWISTMMREPLRGYKSPALLEFWE